MIVTLDFQVLAAWFGGAIFCITPLILSVLIVAFIQANYRRIDDEDTDKWK